MKIMGSAINQFGDSLSFCLFITSPFKASGGVHVPSCFIHGRESPPGANSQSHREKDDEISNGCQSKLPLDSNTSYSFRSFLKEQSFVQQAEEASHCNNTHF